MMMIGAGISTCVDCIAHAHSPAGSSDDADCTCNAGFTQHANQQSCIPCDPGLLQPCMIGVSRVIVADDDDEDDDDDDDYVVVVFQIAAAVRCCAWGLKEKECWEQGRIRRCQGLRRACHAPWTRTVREVLPRIRCRSVTSSQPETGTG
eukprot:2225183-Rhodomonas_salina.5